VSAGEASSVRISQSLIDEIVAHSREDLPNECCGLMGGRDGELTSVHRARNAAETWLRYELHPSDQLRIMSRIEEDGEELAGIYHSHTKSEAFPSQTDINLAEGWPDPLYLICSLADDSKPVVRAFEIRDGGVREVDLDVG
jgi:[CysO sulfur-carrier protein]-S-L-cysteine hydrolase